VNDVSVSSSAFPQQLDIAMLALGYDANTTRVVSHVASIVADVAHAVAAIPASTPTAALTPTPTPTASPAPTPTPTASSTPTPTAAPRPAPSRAPKPTPVPLAACTRTVNGFTAAAVHAARDAAGSGTVCFPAGTYAGELTASVAGQTWRLDPNATLSGAIQVTGRGVTISGGRSERGTGNAWSAGVQVRADDVTVKRMRFVSGGQGVAIYGRDRTTVRDSDFRGLSGGSLSIWGEGRGADDTLFEGNTIVQTLGFHVSPIGGRASEDCSILNRRTIIRDNVMDQGSRLANIGWFGAEFLCHPNILIEGNTFRGGHALVSLTTKTDDFIVRGNRFDLANAAGGGAYWGIEIANVHGGLVQNNVFDGKVLSGTRVAVSMNTNSSDHRIINNRVLHLPRFLELAGAGNVITDNCLIDVPAAIMFGVPAQNTIARNGPCP
jgi:parallel beta helix pectate lyase-like protein